MSPDVHPPREGRFSLLRNRNFLLLWCAYAVSAMGDHLSEMAILSSQGALDPHKDITTLSARMTFVFFVPFFLLGPLAGVLADRLPRRGLMVTADVVRCAILFSFAAWIAWLEPWGSWGPFLPLLPVGIFAALFSPARAALLPSLVKPDQLVRANGLISGLGIIATMAAAGLGGYLADHFAPIVAFRIDAATYVASALFLVALRPPKSASTARSRSDRPSTRRGLLEGFRYVRSHRCVVELISVAMVVWFCGALVNSVIPAVVRDVYGGSYTLISMYRVFIGVGFVLGAIGVATLGHALRSQFAIIWGLVGIGSGMALLALSVFLPCDKSTLRIVGAIGVVISGMSAVTTMASFNTLLQKVVPNRFRGRVFGVKDFAAIGSLLLATGMLASSARFDASVGWILVGVSVIALSAGCLALRARLRRAGRRWLLAVTQDASELLCRFWWGLERTGLSTVPRTGPVILTANHVSSPDPCLLLATSPYRRLSFMVAAEYTRWLLVKYCAYLLGCIPVKRDGRDTAATKEAIRHLRRGGALAIFIEGGIARESGPHAPKDGVAMLALKTGAPVIPAYISGIRYRKSIIGGLWARHRARVRYGPPVDLSEFAGAPRGRENLRAATVKIYQAIQSLSPPEGPYLFEGQMNEVPNPTGNSA